MRITVEPLGESHVRRIAAWHYEPPYDFYDMDVDPGDLEEVLDPERQSRFRAAVDDSGELVGFYYFVPRAREVEVGLGLRPDLTGRQLGGSFLEAGLDYARQTWTPARFRLHVAAFNTRAIRLYERVGFRIVGSQKRALPLGEYEFLELEREA